METAYAYALGANLCFAAGTIIFTIFTRIFGSIWMNYFKAVVATIGFFITVTIISDWHQLTSYSLILFFASGALGLCVGDIFLLKGFQAIGPARSLMIFGLQPIIIGFLSYIFLAQEINTEKLVAIIFFICCLAVFCFENFKATKSWGLEGITFALAGVFLDAVGIIMTRIAFDDSSQVIAVEGNFYRALGAVVAFLIFSLFKPIYLIDRFKSLENRKRTLVIFGSVLGTYLSLLLYLNALKVAHLASISGITITSPIFASIFESLVDRKWPSRYLYLAFAFFLAGMSILVF